MTWKREAKTYEMYSDFGESVAHMKCTQQTINKAIRTFIQTAIGYAAVNIVAIDFSASKQVLKTALVGLGVSAVSAGIAAVMNLEEKNNDI